MAYVREERGKRSERNNSADTSVREEGGGEVLQAPELRFPLQPWRRPWWSRLSHCSQYHAKAGIHPAAHGGLHTRTWLHPEGNCSSWRATAEAGFWQELPGVGDPHSRGLFLKGCTLWSGPYMAAVLEKLQPVERTLGKAGISWITAVCGEDLHWSRGKVWEGRSSKSNCCGLTISPHVLTI